MANNIKNNSDSETFVSAISKSGLSIYDTIEIGDPDLWIPTVTLERLLDIGLKGLYIGDLALRTRSKVVKSKVCEVLGYPVPSSFQKTQPRFPGQCFDTYIQKSNNLQVWNEELSPTRRYVIIHVSDKGLVDRVKVVAGDVLARLDTTGTLTQKYQARIIVGAFEKELVVKQDTDLLKQFVDETFRIEKHSTNPTDNPKATMLLPINIIFDKLCKLIGLKFPDTGYDQERNRGAELHKLVCKQLGYSTYQDDGKFPDIRHQLLEVKLQTSPTVDLGLVIPNSREELGVTMIKNYQIRHCDVRYALFYGRTDGQYVTLTHFFLTTGEAFFTRFPLFQGKVINKKLQIPLPSDFFD